MVSALWANERAFRNIVNQSCPGVAIIVLACVFTCVHEIRPSDKVPAHTGGYYSDKYVSF